LTDRLKYQIRPLQHLYDMSSPPLNMPFLAADWSSMNVVVNDNRIEKRSGYVADRTFVDGTEVQGISLYKRSDGTRNILYLTKSDLCSRETAADKTFSYKTETDLYTGTTQVDAIDAATKLVVTFEAAATIETDGAEAGDFFVLDEDLTADEEHDTEWREIASVDSETQLTLSTAYGKAVTTPGAKNARIRKVYTVPSRERWSHCVVKDKFIFTNGNVDVQSYTGTGYASALDSTNAKKARYCLSYAQRLLIANVLVPESPGDVTFAGSGLDDMTASGASTHDDALTYRIQIDGEGTPDTFKWSDDGGTTWDVETVAITGAAQTLNNEVTITFAATTGHTDTEYWEFTVARGREPWTMQWSKSTDPTDWTDSTAGSVDFVTTDAHITGLGQVGNNVFVYKTDSIIMGYRTGVSTSPFTFPTEKRGIGLYAPDSLVHYMGTNAFLGKDDFYKINGDHPESIGGPIRYKFFDIVDKSEVKYTWGVNVSPNNQIWWFANSKEGQICFVWDYKHNQWTTFDFYNRVEGVGAV